MAGSQDPDYATAERQELAELLMELGPDAPTLCEGWTAADLAAHLVVREGKPFDAVGILVPALADRTEQAMDRLLADHGFLGLIGLLRTGPTGFSPYRIRALDRAANTIEFFVHHEDLRRAQPQWAPRVLDPGFEDLLWRRLRSAGRLLFRRSAVGVLLARRDTDATVRVRGGEPVGICEGIPSELTLYAFGRREVADVELRGPTAATEALVNARLGF